MQHVQFVSYFIFNALNNYLTYPLSAPLHRDPRRARGPHRGRGGALHAAVLAEREHLLLPRRPLRDPIQ